MTDHDAPETALDAVADALIEAHKCAAADGDARLLEQIEAALLYVGRRLAREGQHQNDPDRQAKL